MTYPRLLSNDHESDFSSQGDRKIKNASLYGRFGGGDRTHGRGVQTDFQSRPKDPFPKARGIAGIPDAADMFPAPTRKPPRRPETDVEHYLAKIKTTERLDAKFAVHHANGGNVMLTFQGEFLYFKTKKEAVTVAADLTALGLPARPCYGPVGSGGKTGNEVKPSKV